MEVTDTGLFSGTRTQLLAATFGTLFAISDGMSFGWTSPMIPYLISKDSHIQTTKYEAEWLESCLMIGSFLGLPATIYLVDKIGRKKSLLLAAVLSFFSWLVIALSQSMVGLFIARFNFGIAANTSFVAAPMYVAEIADHKIRGFLSGIIYLNMLFGLIIVYSVGPYLPFFVSPLIGMIVLLAQLVVFPFMPESPYYLICQEKYLEAQKSLEYFRPNRDTQEELKNITMAVSRQKQEGARFQDLFLDPGTRKALIIMSTLDSGQHLCAISVILMNLHLILEAAGSIYMDSAKASITFAVIMFLAAYISSLKVDQYGRKILLIVSLCLTGICLGTLAIYFHLKLAQYDMQLVSWIPIVAVMFYAASYKCGIGMVPIVLTAELFSTNMKALGMTFSDMMYVVGSIVSLQLYQWLVNLYGLHVPFYLFSVCSFALAIFTKFYIPETKGKTLEEIQYLMKSRNPKSESSEVLLSSKSYNTF